MGKIVINVVYKHPNKLRIRVNALKTLTRIAQANVWEPLKRLLALAMNDDFTIITAVNAWIAIIFLQSKIDKKSFLPLSYFEIDVNIHNVKPISRANFMVCIK
jgi:hypothetical protein